MNLSTPDMSIDYCSGDLFVTSRDVAVFLANHTNEMVGIDKGEVLMLLGPEKTYCNGKPKSVLALWNGIVVIVEMLALWNLFYELTD